MTALFSLKLKGFGKTIEHLLRDGDIAALFKPAALKTPPNPGNDRFCFLRVLETLAASVQCRCLSYVLLCPVAGGWAGNEYAPGNDGIVTSWRFSQLLCFVGSCSGLSDRVMVD